MAYPGMVPPPKIDPREVRPSRGWYWLAGIIGAVGCLAGPVLAVVGVASFSSFWNSYPEIGTGFEASTPTTVELTQAQTWAIYVRVSSAHLDPSATPGGTAAPTPSATPSEFASRCTVTAINGGSVDLSEIGYTATVGGAWRQLYRMTVTQDGQYRVACELLDTAAGTARYAVGEDPNFAGALGSFSAGFGSVFGAILIPLAGLIVAGLIVLIVALRRYSNRRELQRQRYPSIMQ